MKGDFQNMFPKKVVISIVAVLCALSFFGNKYLHNTLPEAFAADESFVEEGKSELYLSADGLFTYRIDLQDGSVMITSYCGRESEEKIKMLVIPDEIDGHVVNCIDEYAISLDESLETLILPESLKELRSGFVMQVPNLKTIECEGRYLTVIAEDAFMDYDGDIVTKRDSFLWEYAMANHLKVQETD